MPQIKVYTSDPGTAAIEALGPAFVIIEAVQQAAKFGRGRVVVGAIGQVVNDRGVPGVPVLLPNRFEDLESSYGGYKDWLGNGKASGYEGNLWARTKGLDVPVLVLQPVDAAVKTATIASGTDLKIKFTRSVGTYGDFTLKAGFRVKTSAGGYVVATLEDVTWTGTTTGDKEVRFRQVSGTPAALNTVTTLLDTPADANVTCNTAATTVPDEIDAAELILRYKDAITKMLSTVAGKSCGVVFTDQDVLDIGDALSVHATTASGSAYFRVAVVSPPIGTTAATAEGVPTDGIGRTTLDKTRTAYTHEAVKRRFVEDADNLTAPEYLVDVPAAALLAARIAEAPPWENPANPSRLFQSYGVVGNESLATPPVLQTHYAAGIVQLDWDADTAGRLSATFFSGILGDGSEISDRRMKDYIELGVVNVLRPYHKKPASASRRQGAEDATIDFLQGELDAEHILAFSVTTVWDGTNQFFTVKYQAQLAGNMNTIINQVDVGAGVIVTTQG